MLALLSRISLLFILVIAAISELLLNRVGVHLATPAVRAASEVFPIVDDLGLFAFYFTGVLSLGVLAWGLAFAISDTCLFRAPLRIGLMLLGAALLPLASTALFAPLPVKLLPYLNLSFGLMVLLLTGAFIGHRASLRHKLGLLYLVAPLLLHCYWLATKQMPPLMPLGPDADLPTRLLEVGQHLVVVGAFASFLFFAPLPRLSQVVAPIPVLVALTLTAGAALLVGWHYPLAAKITYLSVGIHLPAPTAGGAAHLALNLSALFFFSLTVVSLLMQSTKERALALGLLLVGVSGYHLELPYQLALTLVGLLQIVRAGIALDLPQPEPSPESTPAGGASKPGPISAATWRDYLKGVTSEFGATDLEPVVIQGELGRIARVRGLVGGLPVTIRCQVRQDPQTQLEEVSELEIDFGQVPKDAAPASLYRRRARRAHRIADGKSPKVDFDPDFVLRDSTETLADGLVGLTEPLRESIHGCISIWPSEGLRYVARPLSDGWPVPLPALTLNGGAEGAELMSLVELLSVLAATADAADIR